MGKRPFISIFVQGLIYLGPACTKQVRLDPLNNNYGRIHVVSHFARSRMNRNIVYLKGTA